MGCGGSRADAIEPRYYESWTRETESTWLTYTDSDALPSAAATDSGPEAGGLHAGVLEDGLSSNGVLRPAAQGGIANPEKKMNCGTQCPNSQSLSSGPLIQKQNGLWATETKSYASPKWPWIHYAANNLLPLPPQGLPLQAKRDAKRMSAREVTLNVTENIRQMDRSKRVTKNCVN